MTAPPTRRVRWDETHRLVLSRFPPIDFYDDVADPRDWEALATAQSRTNPRLFEEIGDLSLVPVDRRLSGKGAAWVMAAFTHVSVDRTTRFGDGTYGVYYAGDTLETALYEHTFHMARFYRDAGVAPGWISQVRQLVGAIDTDLTDLRGSVFDDILSPDLGSYAAAQAFARARKAAGANGIVYPSQRHPGGECIAAFYPDVATPPRQADRFRYHWNGRDVDFVQQLTGRKTMFELRPAVSGRG